MKLIWNSIRTRVLKQKLEVNMKNIIEGMKVLEQTPIKDYTTLSGVLIAIGISRQQYILKLGFKSAMGELKGN